MNKPRFCTLSAPLAQMPHLPAMLGGPVRHGFLPWDATVLAWGDRQPARMAAILARLGRRPLLRLEDGFLRSVGLGKAGAPTVAVIVDRTGMHFDARHPSDIETLINRAGRTPAQRDRSKALLDTVRREQLDKYNLPASSGRDPIDGAILLIDQVAGDRSIAGAGADRSTFLAMLAEAITTHGASSIVVKTHPDVINGFAAGNLTEAAARQGIRLIDSQLPVDDLTGRVRAIWTVSSTMGFEALMRGIPVVTFGMPFYAGWGLSDDRAEGRIAHLAGQRRQAKPHLLDLVAAVFLDYTRYGNPWTGERLEAEAALALLAQWKKTVAAGRNFPEQGHVDA